MVKEKARDLTQWCGQYTGRSQGSWCSLAVQIVKGVTVTGMPVYLCLHFPLITKNTVFLWLSLFLPTMFLPQHWSQSSSRPGFGCGLQGAEEHCVEVQGCVAESSGWDPPMHMELSPSLVFRVTLTRPRFFSSPFTLTTNRFLGLFAGSHLYPCEA